MKRIFTFLLLLGSISSFASHLMGGQITATQISGLQYRIDMVLYRDTMGIPMQTNGQFTIYGAGAASTVGFVLDSSGDLQGFPCGVQWYAFHANYTFPASGNYTITFNNCCRNQAISNMTTPTGESLQLNTALKVDNTVANSSPQFLSDPIAFVGLNQAWSHNPLVYDPDGDSVSFVIDTPLTAYPRQFVAGYTQPTSASAYPFNVNVFTGEIRWQPLMVGNYVISYRVDEFRNGVKIGSVLRDYQFKVIQTTNSSPALNSISSNGWSGIVEGQPGVYTADFSPGINSTITITAVDPNQDPIIMKAYGSHFRPGMSPASFQTNSASGITTGLVNWTPNVGDNPWNCLIRIGDVNSSVRLFRDVTITLRARNATATQELSRNERFTVYPNPSSEVAQVRFDLKSTSEVQIQLVDMRGSLVRSMSLGKYSEGQHTVILDASGIASGLYTLQLNLDGTVAGTQRWMKK